MTDKIKSKLLGMLGISATLLPQVGSEPSDFAIRHIRILNSLHAGKPTDSSESATWHKRQRKSIQGGQYCMADVAIFLETVYSLSRVNEHKAVDEIYNFIDNCLSEGEFDICDAALRSMAPERIPLSAAISFLIVTRKANCRLPAREVFFNRTLQTPSVSATVETACALQKYR